jgi:hypothetical protein
MDDVKRYHWSPDHADGFGYGSMDATADARSMELVEAAQLDAQRLRADTAEGERDDMAKSVTRWTDRACDYRDQLAAAGQRIAELKGLLIDLTLDDDFPEHWNESYAIDAALNPNPEAGSHE